MLRRFVPVLGFAFGCAATPPPAMAPTPPPRAESPEAKAESAPGPKAVVPAAVPPPPAECAELVAHATSNCAPAGPARDTLAAALAITAPAERDAALACLEASAELPPGSIRAIRAELVPEVCADALVVPVLEAPPKNLVRELESAMLGLVVAGRLSRLLADPPKPEAPITKERFRTYFRETLTPWVLSQAAAIEKLSLEGSRLAGYGRGLAAIAAGNADLRFVEMVREVPLPDEMQADKDVRDAYYGALDEALEPRKLRGRDAALVGLRAFAEIGAFGDARVSRARALLTKLWSGSRVDALDELLLPDVPPLELASSVAGLAARLPTFHAGYLLRDADVTDPKFVRALLEQGVPAPLRLKLDAAALPERTRLLYAHALVESGRRFFRAADFRRARSLLVDVKSDDGRLLSGIAQALETGPEHVAELMLKGPFVRGTGDVSGLDAEAARKGRYAGRAAFDAAYVLELAPRPDDAAYWDELAKRYAAAERLLQPNPRAKQESSDAARARRYHEAARATAAAIRQKR